MIRSLFIFLLGAALTSTCPAAPPAPAIHWTTWSDDLFERARREHKFVLLDLEAVWCHWCHVMDQNTYSDPEVVALIRGKYIAVKVDRIRGRTFAAGMRTGGGRRRSCLGRMARHPHFEKIMQFQSQAVRTYALGRRQPLRGGAGHGSPGFCWRIRSRARSRCI